jgi:hypothetical protein
MISANVGTGGLRLGGSEVGAAGFFGSFFSGSGGRDMAFMMSSNEGGFDLSGMR